MAKNDNVTAQSLQDELTDLKAEILELSKSIASNAGSAAERAGPILDAAKDKARHAADSVREQGQAAVDVIRENPGTTTSVALTAGLIGLAIGYMFGSSGSNSNSFWRS